MAKLPVKPWLTNNPLALANMSTLAERLNEAMREAKVSPADLVRATGAKAPSVHKWVHGITKNLRGNNLVVVASMLNVSEAWLADGVGPKSRTKAEWPFSIPYTEYLALSEAQQEALDMMVTAFFAGARASSKSASPGKAAA